MTVTTTATTVPRHWPVLTRVHGGWLAGCGCGWRHPGVTPRERSARRKAWEHVAAAEADR